MDKYADRLIHSGLSNLWVARGQMPCRPHQQGLHATWITLVQATGPWTAYCTGAVLLHCKHALSPHCTVCVGTPASRSSPSIGSLTALCCSGTTSQGLLWHCELCCVASSHLLGSGQELETGEGWGSPETLATAVAKAIGGVAAGLEARDHKLTTHRQPVGSPGPSQGP